MIDCTSLHVPDFVIHLLSNLTKVCTYTLVTEFPINLYYPQTRVTHTRMKVFLIQVTVIPNDCNDGWLMSVIAIMANEVLLLVNQY